MGSGGATDDGSFMEITVHKPTGDVNHPTTIRRSETRVIWIPPLDPQDQRMITLAPVHKKNREQLGPFRMSSMCGDPFLDALRTKLESASRRDCLGTYSKKTKGIEHRVRCRLYYETTTGLLFVGVIPKSGSGGNPDVESSWNGVMLWAVDNTNLFDPLMNGFLVSSDKRPRVIKADFRAYVEDANVILSEQKKHKKRKKSAALGKRLNDDTNDGGAKRRRLVTSDDEDDEEEEEEEDVEDVLDVVPKQVRVNKAGYVMDDWLASDGEGDDEVELVESRALYSSDDEEDSDNDQMMVDAELVEKEDRGCQDDEVKIAMNELQRAHDHLMEVLAQRMNFAADEDGDAESVTGDDDDDGSDCDSQLIGDGGVSAFMGEFDEKLAKVSEPRHRRPKISFSARQRAKRDDLRRSAKKTLKRFSTEVDDMSDTELDRTLENVLSGTDSQPEERRPAALIVVDSSDEEDAGDATAESAPEVAPTPAPEPGPATVPTPAANLATEVPTPGEPMPGESTPGEP